MRDETKATLSIGLLSLLVCGGMFGVGWTTARRYAPEKIVAKEAECGYVSNEMRWYGFYLTKAKEAQAKVDKVEAQLIVTRRELASYKLANENLGMVAEMYVQTIDRYKKALYMLYEKLMKCQLDKGSELIWIGAHSDSEYPLAEKKVQ